jgi:SAM-dependent methyltransferase
MNAEQIDFLWSILACPQCFSSPLVRTNTGVKCTSCNTQFEETGNRQLNFRLKREKKVSIPFFISPRNYEPDEDLFNVLPLNENHENSIVTPHFLSKEMASYIPRPSSKASIMLDLGCGDTRHRSNFEQAGFKYVGLDYDSKEATLLGDAHALPFRNESFEFLFSFAVLEHLRFPFVAIDEAYRVLKHGSRFIGSVAFLEPFHGQSFYHHTHYGLLNSLEHAGFTVNCISPDTSWDVLNAQASMSLFPKMPKSLAKALVFPLRTISKLYWKTGRFMNPQAKEITRLLCTAGAFMFVALKR